jgi:hypothetical protein
MEGAPHPSTSGPRSNPRGALARHDAAASCPSNSRGSEAGRTSPSTRSDERKTPLRQGAERSSSRFSRIYNAPASWCSNRRGGKYTSVALGCQSKNPIMVAQGFARLLRGTLAIHVAVGLTGRDQTWKRPAQGPAPCSQQYRASLIPCFIDRWAKRCLSSRLMEKRAISRARAGRH